MAKLKAYSLIELSVSLAIAGIISAAALSTYGTLVGSMYSLRAQSTVDTRLQRVSRAFSADLQEVGGGAIRPWHAVFVQPNVDAADGLLVVTADADARPCTVVNFDRAGKRLRLDDDACPVCSDPPPAAGAEGEYFGRFAVLSKPGSGEGTIISLQSRTSGSCTLIARPFLDMGAAVADWTDASMTVADAKWVFLDAATHELKAWLLYDPGSAPAAAVIPPEENSPRGTLQPYFIDERMLASDVYDFQVALGYDVDFNNIVTETVTATDDEWFGNAAGEMPTTAWIGDDGSEFTSALVVESDHRVQQIRLRAASIGFVMGAKARGPMRPAVAVLDGPRQAEAGMYFRSTITKAIFRNAGATQ
ncbi:MAG: prepilin-type N-terminal cleavage/methylation domain-containing protein [Deltaproteobacteria bacterium]|nr:prepilin-type N-terminal cleavage/methylation domain-containing protein [Deltaproteobacteria bacterium]